MLLAAALACFAAFFWLALSPARRAEQLPLYSAPGAAGARDLKPKAEEKAEAEALPAFWLLPQPAATWLHAARERLLPLLFLPRELLWRPRWVPASAWVTGSFALWASAASFGVRRGWFASVAIHLAISGLVSVVALITGGDWAALLALASSAFMLHALQRWVKSPAITLWHMLAVFLAGALATRGLAWLGLPALAAAWCVARITLRFLLWQRRWWLHGPLAALLLTSSGKDLAIGPIVLPELAFIM